MKLGNKIFIILSLALFFSKISLAEQKISTTTLLNIDEIKPSFEELDEKLENTSNNRSLKEKKK